VALGQSGLCDQEWVGHELEVKVETATPAEGDAVGLFDANRFSGLTWHWKLQFVLYSY